MAEYMIKTKNRKEGKVVEAFLSSLDIDFYTEAQQEKALYKKMQVDRKTRLLNQNEKENFIKQLKSTK
ncbi:MAG: hypothetical protein WKG06_25155 [Segetibacter sp.]